jgi:hypothetical protein
MVSMDDNGLKCLGLEEIKLNHLGALNENDC